MDHDRSLLLSRCRNAKAGRERARTQGGAGAVNTYLGGLDQESSPPQEYESERGSPLILTNRGAHRAAPAPGTRHPHQRISLGVEPINYSEGAGGRDLVVGQALHCLPSNDAEAVLSSF